MKAILVDDEQLALDFLGHQLEKVGGIDIIGKYNNLSFYYDDGQTLLDTIDVIFLDIEMAGMSGLELAEKLLETNPSLSIVFVTAYNEYAVDAFALHVLDYLMKPVQVERLRQTVKRIEQTKHVSAKKEHVNGSFLHINVCNELTFQISENTYDTLKWRTVKARELFLYLLQSSDRTVQKDELIDLLWPDLDEERAFPQLYTAIYHIRKILQPFDEYISIHNNHGGYRLGTTNVSLDVVLWESRITANSPVSIENIGDYETHMRLYTGPYLGSYDYMWAEGEQHRLELLWLKTASRMASVYEKNGQMENAVEWYVRICTVSPEDEDSQFALMTAYAKLGLGMLVGHQYKQLEQALTGLGLEVNEEITDWYLDWKNRKGEGGLHIQG